MGAGTGANRTACAGLGADQTAIKIPRIQTKGLLATKMLTWVRGLVAGQPQDAFIHRRQGYLHRRAIPTHQR